MRFGSFASGAIQAASLDFCFMEGHRTGTAKNQPPTLSDVLPVGTVLGDYTILRVLGQGGVGVTYLAHDAGLDQDVVLKENLPTQFAGRGGDSLTVTSRGGREARTTLSGPPGASWTRRACWRA